MSEEIDLLGPGGIFVDGLYVPPIGFFGVRNFGEMVWGKPCTGEKDCPAKMHANDCPKWSEWE